MGNAAEKIVETTDKPVVAKPAIAEAPKGKAIGILPQSSTRIATVRTGKVLDVAEAEKLLPLPTILKAISERHKKSFQSIVGEIARYAFSGPKVTAEEYLTLRMFDDAKLTAADKAKFAGSSNYQRMWIHGNFMRDWLGVINDKLAFNALFGSYGMPVVKLKALYHTDFVPPGYNPLRSADDIRTFLRNPDSYPFFSKPVRSSLSLGSASVVGYDEATDKLKFLSGKQVAAADFIDDIITNFEGGYLFQERVKPHDEVRALCGERAATVRVYTLNGPRGPEIFRAAWKIPGGKNAADNFWRKGNILAAIDMKTGIVTRAVTGMAVEQIELQAHPDTGRQLVGTKVPNWETICNLALVAARILPDIRCIGWDIVPTDEGGTIIEGNPRPDFKLVQMAEGRGIQDEQMDEFIKYVVALKKDLVDFGRSSRRRWIRKGMSKYVANAKAR